MASEDERLTNHGGQDRRSPWYLAALTIALFAAAIVLILRATDDGLGILDGGTDATLSYMAIFALIAGDAVVPILPGETTLNAAAVLASQGKLELSLVIVAGSLGAIVGDSLLYWISRTGLGGVRRRVEQAQDDRRVAFVLRVLGNRGPMLIVLGRFVPGVRFFVNVSMGITRMRYPTFLLWSTIGGTLWATYTALLAFAVGTALDDYPLLSIVISGLVTTTLLGAVYWHDVRRQPTSSGQSQHPA